MKITQKDIDDTPVHYTCKYSKDCKSGMIYIETDFPTKEEADKDIEMMISDGYKLQEIWETRP